MIKYFEKEYKIKWHDTDAGRICRISPLLMYMQETANIQCREFGYDLDSLRDNEHMALILSSISMNFYAPLNTGDVISVRTWCPMSSAASSTRCFKILKDGQTVAEASSIWAIVDTESHRLIRASVYNSSHIAPVDEPIDPDILPPRPHVSPDMPMEKVGERTIRYSDIDYNMHMNNTHYPDMICDFLPDMNRKCVKSMAIAFRSEAHFGETLTAELSGSCNSFLFRTLRCDGSVNIEASVELTEV